MSEQRRLPPLNAVRAFEAAGRLGSFTAASRELSVSPGAISRHVSNLEGYFNAELFWRRHHEIGLTQIGREFMERASAALIALEDASRNLRERTGNKQLRVKVLPTFGVRWLIPRLARFQARHPAIDVQLTTSVDNTGLTSGEVDLIVAHRPTTEASESSELLFKTRLIPVCSSKLASEKGQLRQPSDLGNSVLLHSLGRPEDWSRWLAHAGADEIRVKGVLKFGNSSMMYQAAVESMGVACAQYELVQDDLAAGRLVTPFDLFLDDGVPHYLSVLKSGISRQKVRAFRDWLLEECRATQ